MAALLLLPALRVSHAQYTPPYVEFVGTFSSSNGMPAPDYAIEFQPTQVMFVGGTSVVVEPSHCATDKNGAVVGIDNPQQPPIVSSTGSGALPAGTYYTKFSWYDTYNHETLTSPEIALQLNTAGSLVVTPPATGAPLNALGMFVYIGTTPGGETYQGESLTPTGSYTQAAALASGGTPQVANTTVCQVVANDAAWPIGGYTVTFFDGEGNPVPGFPQQWQMIGPGSAFNISQGFPIWNGRTTYPVPVLTIPTNHNPQSISGSLSLSGYNLYNVGEIGVGTALPAWGVDVEGSGLAGLVNARGGYLVNGASGTAGECLASDGTAFNTVVACVTSLPSINYQTVLNGSHGSDAVPQRGYLAVGTGTGLVANDVVGVGSQVSRTVLNVNAAGDLNVDPQIVNTAGSGTAGNCAQWDTAGGLGQAAGPCASGTSSASRSGYVIIPAQPQNIILEWGTTTAFDTGPQTVLFPLTFPHTALNVSLTDCSDCAGSSTTARIWLADTLTATSFQARNDGTGAAWYFAVGW